MNTKTIPRICIHTGELILVNPGHPLAAGATPAEDLLPVDAEGQVLLAATPAKMLGLLLQASGAEAHVVATSGYRTHAQQVQLYRESLRENGPEFTATYVALPGCSEHESGLAVDLAAASDTIDPIRPELPTTGVYGRFRALAPHYGFIQRYPEGKQSLTAIGCEPWHFRYVGWPHAQIIHDRGLVLEEYLLLLQTYQSSHTALHYEEGGKQVRIFTAPGHIAQSVAQACADEGWLWQASGNNMDGVVFTLWK